MKKCVSAGFKMMAALLVCSVLDVGCGLQVNRENDPVEILDLTSDSAPAADERESVCDGVDDVATDYQAFSGFWSEDGMSHEEIVKNGGIELYAEITDRNELSGWIYAQQWQTERFAEIDDISCRIEDGQGYYPFTDDGWGNCGTLHIWLKQDEIRITVEDFVLSDENPSGYGISGSYILNRSNMTQVSDLDENTDMPKESGMEEQSEQLGQYSADWSEDRLIEELEKRGQYRDQCAYYSEWMNYMENVREVRDISMYIDPLYATDTKVYSREDFVGVPPLILHLAKNEIYARHGYIFKDSDLNNYFMMQVWYLPRVTSEGFDDSVFNEIEKHNLEILKGLDTY